MAQAPRGRSTDGYKTVGRTYDGVEVPAPKTRSKTLTSAEVRQAIKLALKQAGVPSAPRKTKATKSLGETDKLRVQQRDDGRVEVRRPGA